MSKFLSAQEVATRLGVPASTVYSWAAKNEGPPSFKLGKHRKFDSDDLELWVEQMKRRGDQL